MAARQLPQTFRKIVVNTLGHKFRDVTSIVQVPISTPREGEILVKNRFLGINASDVNFSAGRYTQDVQPPFDVGFEAIGEVVDTGPGTRFKVGQPVMFIQYGSFSEYLIVNAKRAIPVPSVNPEFVPLIVSGLTASIALDRVGEIKKGETVLVTAAAGGTGQFAVQWAKNAGCHVIGTCSTQEKVDFLKSIGCDRPINYKQEELKAVLKQEYPKGIDVIYESVGGDMFDLCMNSLAMKGRLVVIGFISAYQTDLGFKPSRMLATLPVKLLTKSSSVRGFFFEHYLEDVPQYMAKMVDLYTTGRLRSVIDRGETAASGPFVGLEKVTAAVEYLYTQQSIGKIIVELPDSPSSKL